MNRHNTFSSQHTTYYNTLHKIPPPLPPPLQPVDHPHPPQSYHSQHVPQIPNGMPPPRTSHPAPTEPPRLTHDSASLRELEVGFTAALEKVHNHSATRLDRIEIAIGGLTKVAKDALQMATTARQEAKEGFDRLHAVILHSAKRSLAKSERLEAILGDSDAATHEETSTTVLGRINQLELAIMELTESVSDPDAARSVTVRHEAAVNTSPQLRATVDVGVHAVDRTLSLQQSEVGIQAGLAAGTEGRSDDRQRRSAVTRSLFIPSTVHPQVPPLISISPYSVHPAQWGPRLDASDPSSSRETSGVSSPTPQLLSRVDDTSHLAAEPVQLERRSSSTYDEQEIINTLENDMDDVSSDPFSPPEPGLSSTLTSRLIHAPIPLPSRTTSIPKIPPSLSATSPTISGGGSSSTTSPLPRYMGILAASGTVPLRPPPPPPRDLTRVAVPNASVSAESPSSTFVPGPAPSTSSNTSPPLPSQSPERRVQSQQHPPLPPPPLPRQRLRTRSSSLSSMSSLSSLATTVVSPSSGQEISKQKHPEEAVRASSSSTKVSESANAAGTKKIKDEQRESTPVTRAAKRRKTLGAALELHIESENTPATVFSASAKAGRAGNGRSRVSKKGKHKAQLVITPVKEAVRAPQQPNSPRAERRRYQPPRIGTDCPWPPKIMSDETSRREFVQCDNCEGWYHFGCVGLTTGDPRLEPDATFYCPPCESSEAISHERRNVRFKEAACVRPDCDFPGSAEDTNEYFVERIIGRRPFRQEIDADVRQPCEFMWLVKWDGWKADQATWAANEHLGDCVKIIEDFEQAAIIEGRNVDTHEKTILLNEAIAAGWM